MRAYRKRADLKEARELEGDWKVGGLFFRAGFDVVLEK